MVHAGQGSDRRGTRTGGRKAPAHVGGAGVRPQQAQRRWLLAPPRPTAHRSDAPEPKLTTSTATLFFFSFLAIFTMVSCDQTGIVQWGL